MKEYLVSVSFMSRKYRNMALGEVYVRPSTQDLESIKSGYDLFQFLKERSREALQDEMKLGTDVVVLSIVRLDTLL